MSVATFEGTWLTRGGWRATLGPEDDGVQHLGFIDKEGFEHVPLSWSSSTGNSHDNPSFDLVERLSGRAGAMK